RTVAMLESRRQRELRTQVANLAENPTLKAALDTYVAEAFGADEGAQAQLVATIKRELDKLAARVEADAIVLIDARGTTLAAVGRLGDRWPAGRPVMPILRRENADDFDGVLQTAGGTFR